MKIHSFLKLSVAFGVLFLSCKKEIKEVPSHLGDEIEEVKSIFAPDKRVALFSIDVEKTGDNYIIKGESNLPKAVAELKENLQKKNVAFIDSIAILPTKELKGKTKGLVTISVANIRSNPKHSAELATQATLGTPINILKKQGDWVLVQTPDNYISWVDYGAIKMFTKAEFAKWKNLPKLIYTQTMGYAYSSTDDNAQVVSDLVAGGILELLQEKNDFYNVRFPDGREAFVLKSEAEEYKNWLSQLNPEKDDLVAVSKKLMGLPYLWGGTSSKGVDCSGFTKTIYFLNGIVIPRDASQQVHTGKLIDEVGNFENLQKGDLLFFGRKLPETNKEKVVHVGMWIGNNEFIHSSGAGRVQINSIDSTATNYDAFNLGRYLRTKRLLNQQDDNLVDIRKESLFK